MVPSGELPASAAALKETCRFLPMSSPLSKGLRRSPARSAGRRPTPAAVKSRSPKAKSDRADATRAVPAKSAGRKVSRTPAAKKSASKTSASRKAAASKTKPVKKAAVRQVESRKSTASRQKSIAVPRVKKTQKLAALRARRPVAAAPPAPRQQTVDESAALKAFARAPQEFSRGRFGEARNQFRLLLDKYSQVSEVAARARTYLAIAESRLRTESMLPRDADSLYDRGVIELNRGEYVAAQEMFERALKREPEAAHIHYGLAATRARLGSIDLALQSLERALNLQPNLRVRAQHDQDLTSLRNDPDFDKLVFQPRL